jgi:hypothetical protein
MIMIMRIGLLVAGHAHQLRIYPDLPSDVQFVILSVN